MSHSLSLVSVVLGLSGVLWGCAASRRSAPGLEVVATAPVETTLAVEGVRDTQRVWLELLSGARRTLDVEAFYVSDAPGEALEPVLAAIRAAAARGVVVRLVVDRRFLSLYPESVAALDALSNVEARVVDYAPHGGVQHAKFFVVDGVRAFVGSANLDWRALRHIHEVGLRIEDPSVAEGLTRVFQRDWGDAARLTPDGERVRSAPATSGSPSHPDVTLLASPPATTPQGVRDSLGALLSALAGARRGVSIQLFEYALRGHGPDQTPWRALDDALRAAAARGVSVRLLLDATALRRGEEELRSLTEVPNVEVRLVTIPRWSGGEIPYARLIHSKFMVVDGALAWVGTENWDPGYFLRSRNVGVMVRSPSVVATLAGVFERVWSSPYATRLTAAP